MMIPNSEERKRKLEELYSFIQENPNCFDLFSGTTDELRRIGFKFENTKFENIIINLEIPEEWFLQDEERNSYKNLSEISEEYFFVRVFDERGIERGNIIKINAKIKVQLYPRYYLYAALVNPVVKNCGPYFTGVYDRMENKLIREFGLIEDWRNLEEEKEEEIEKFQKDNPDFRNPFAYWQ